MSLQERGNRINQILKVLEKLFADAHEIKDKHRANAKNIQELNGYNKFLHDKQC